MPNPFPGMNPYLESQLLWAGIHDGLMGTLKETLNTILPPGFVARMGERGKGETRTTFVEVIQPNMLNRIVTVLEISSYRNKTTIGPARPFSSNTHFVEIDLLREGKPTLAPQPALLKSSGKRYDYAVCLHRAGAGGQCEAWTRTVRRPLPRFPVPLTLYLPAVTIDLQNLLNRVYEAGAYDKIIDYAAPADPPLREIDAEWAGGILRQNGLRPAP